MEGSTGPPGLLLLFVPILCTLGVFILAVAEHLYYVKNTAFQAVYLRALALFPLTSLVLVVGGIFYRALVWMNVVVAFLEGYIFILFFGLLTGWAWTRGNVHKALLSCTRTRFFCFCMQKTCGSEARSGRQILNRLKWRVIQLSIVKPSTALLFAIATQVTTEHHQLRIVKALLAIINVVSVIVALRGLVDLFLALKGGAPSKNLLSGLQAFHKFTIVKALLFFIIVNELLIGRLIDGKVIVPPSFLCNDIDISTNDPDFDIACGTRLEIWIFNFEALALVIIGIMYFRPHDVDKIPLQMKSAYTSLPCTLKSDHLGEVEMDQPSPVESDQETNDDGFDDDEASILRTRKNICILIMHIFFVWDVLTIFLRPPPEVGRGSRASVDSINGTSLDVEDENCGEQTISIEGISSGDEDRELDTLKDLKAESVEVKLQIQ